MAEGFLRAAGPGFSVMSAGTAARGVHPLAIAVMAEVGLDISSQRSKTVEEVGEDWDVVVTVCDSSCPIPPRSALLLRWRFPDPAAAGGSNAESVAAFRAVRDGIRRRVELMARRLERLPADPSL